MLYFYSPLPPSKSGPADYVETLLLNMERKAGAKIKEAVTLLYDSSDAPDPNKLREANWRIHDHNFVKPNPNDTYVYFLASNPQHYFVYDTLQRHDNVRSIAVIHDLAAGFFVRGLSQVAKSAVGDPELLKAFEFDLGHRAPAIINCYEDIQQLATFFIMAHGLTIERTERVYVHSHYAKTRLLFESAIDIPFDKVRVAEFPRRPGGRKITGRPAKSGKFRVSMLGFYHEAKRYPSVLMAWTAFAGKLPADQRRNIELIFGGELSDHVRRPLEDMIANEPGSESVRFLGYLSETDLDEFIMTSSLVINLRFPSWGETSAMVHRVVELGCPVVVSAFAGYHEELAAKRISVDPIDEVDELIETIEEAFALWCKGDRLQNARPLVFGPKLDLTREMIALAGD